MNVYKTFLSFKDYTFSLSELHFRPLDVIERQRLRGREIAALLEFHFLISIVSFQPGGVGRHIELYVIFSLCDVFSCYNTTKISMYTPDYILSVRHQCILETIFLVVDINVYSRLYS